MPLDTGTVEVPPAWQALNSARLSKISLLQTAFSPAAKVVVERHSRTIGVFMAIAAATAVYQRMDNAGERPQILYFRHAAPILRQDRFDPRPMLIRKPEKPACHHTSTLGEAGAHLAATVNFDDCGPDSKIMLIFTIATNGT